MQTIHVTKETKELIESFGTKEESHDEIVRRIYKLAVKQQFQEFLRSSENSISIDKAIKRHKKRWQNTIT